MLAMMADRDEYAEVFDNPEPQGIRMGRIASRRTPVDFSVVPHHQQDMHGRLLDWARSIRSRESPAVSPGFELYRSSDARREDRVSIAVPVDQRDAAIIGRGVAALPFRECKALGWYYTKGARAAPEMAREVCLSMRGLAETVIRARQMLIDAGV